MIKIYRFAFIYLIIGLVFGVFYREFTVYHNYNGHTQLAFLHTHSLVLGTIFFIIVMILNQLYKVSDNKRFTLWLVFYNLGFVGLLGTMYIRGMGQVLAWELSGFNHVAGLFHTILGASLIWFMIILGKKLNPKNEIKT